MSSDSEMSLTEEAYGNAIVLTASGKINSVNAKEFGERMSRLIEAGCKHLVVDLSEVTFMTSAGFRALLIAGKTAAKTSSEYALCGLNENLHRLFELGGFIDLFPIYSDSETALKKHN